MEDCTLFIHRPWQRIVGHQKSLKISQRCSEMMLNGKDLEFEREPYEKVIQNPKSLKWAMRAYCFDCCLDQRSEVKSCTATKCPFYNFRPLKES